MGVANNIDASRILNWTEENPVNQENQINQGSDNILSESERSAIEQYEAFKKSVSEMEASHTTSLPIEIQKLV